MRRIALVLVFVLASCGSTLITKTDPDTGVCYMHERQWIIWQISNDIYRADTKDCTP